MRIFKELVKTDLLMYVRNYALIWVPITFILLAIMDPITTHYTPIILENIGGFPEGMIFEFPEIPAIDAFMMSISEFSMFGILIVILLTMNAVSGDKKTGVSELLLARPIKARNYILSKFVSRGLLFIASTVIGFLFSLYYVWLLFGELPLVFIFLTMAFYSIWVLFAISITLFYSTLLKSGAAAAGLTILTLGSLSLINTIFSNRLPWFFNNLSSLIYTMLNEQSVSTDLIYNLILISSTTIGILLLTIVTFKRKEYL